MTMAQTRNKFSRKTIAIALAAGMTLGGVTVAAPTAGAVAGYEQAYDWRGATGKNNPGNLDPYIQYKNTPTWGTPFVGSGGVYVNVPTADGELTGFSGVYGSRSAGDSAGGEGLPYGEHTLLRDMKTSGIRESESPQRDMSMDSKKMLYVAYSFANDVVKNQGLSQQVRDKLVQNGYTGEFIDDVTMTRNFWASQYGDILTFDKKPSVEEVRNKATTGDALVITKGDYVAYVASHVAGSVYTLDGGADPVGVIQGGKDRPLTFDDMLNKDIFYFNDLDSVEKDNNYDKAIADRLSMAHAMINIARGVSDQEINNADLKVYKNPDLIWPPFFSLSNSSPAPVEELPQAPAEDIYVSDVKKDKDGNYEVTRNDGESWIIDLKDIRDKIAELENKDTVSPEDLNKVKDELDKAKDGIDGLKGKDAKTDKAIQDLRDDLNKLEPRVDKLEERVDKLEGLVIKEVRDNGDGTYTLIRVDGSEVKGNIDGGDNITKIVDNGDGSITIVKADGTKEKVNLSQTVVTETNKGKPNHTITITTPDGKKITFNAFDTYVTEVKKNAKGDYDIYRSDVNDGKTVWKTIVLSDIRGKITKLEDDLTKLTEKQAKDVKDIKNQIADLEKEIESLQGAQDDLDKRVTKLEANLTALTLRVTNLEKRVDGLEETDAAWAKCYAGIGATGVPMLMALPLALMSDLNIPGLGQLNTQIQRTIGMYNPEAAKWMNENRGMFSAATGVLTAAGVLGMLIHTAKECQPYNQTPGVQDNMNPIIEGSSKIAEKVESGSSKDENKPEDKGSSVNAGSSTRESNRESTDNGSSTEAGSSTDKDK